jgi:hypothetical protein
MDEVKEQALENQSIKQFIDPDDIAALVVFLAGPHGRTISGQMIRSTVIPSPPSNGHRLAIRMEHQYAAEPPIGRSVEPPAGARRRRPHREEAGPGDEHGWCLPNPGTGFSHRLVERHHLGFEVEFAWFA